MSLARIIPTAKGLLLTAAILCPFPFSLLPSPFSLFPSPFAVLAQGRNAPVAVRDVSVRFEHLTVADGLSQTTIYAIYQDRLGFMWFATQDGLNMYDGHNFKVYRREPFDTTAIGDNTISSIAEDHDGFIWVGTGRGLYRMSQNRQTFTAFRHRPDDPASLSNDFVRHIVVDSENRVWVATGRGLERYDRETGGFVHYVNDPDDESSINYDGVSSIYEGIGGRLWVATARGLNRMRPDLSGFDRFLEAEVFPGDLSPTEYGIQRMLERPEEPGILWVGTTRGLVRFDPDKGEAETFLPTADPRPHRVADLVQDPITRQVLWLGVPGAGLGRFDIRTSQFTIYGSDPTDPQSLSTTNTERVFVDRSGMLWVGVAGVGVDRFNPATVGMTHLRHDPGNPQSLPGAHVRGVYQDSEGGLWVGTTDRQGVSRVSRFDPVTRTFRHFEHSRSDPNSLGEGRIRAVLVDRTGALWVGIGTAGLDRMVPERPGRFQHFRMDRNRPASLSHNTVRYLLEDRSGAIWVATNGGLDRVLSADEGTFAHYRHDPDDEETLTGNRTSVLFESRSGAIWVGADGGLNRLDPLTGAVKRYRHDPGNDETLASDAVLAIYERDREPGIIWVGTFGGGLGRLDFATGIIRNYGERDGLPNNTVYGILEDSQGRLWMSTNLGLSRLDPETGSFRNYGLDVGLQSLEYNSAAFHKGIYGEMFFGGVNGLNAFFPDELTENSHAPEVVIVDVRVSHSSLLDLPNVPRDRAVPDIRKIDLDHDQSDVAFNYVALHYQNPTQNRYSYQLVGYDDGWIDSGSDRSATYTNLPPGDYVFRVRAANSDGVWNEQGASIEVSIAPPWWRTWWALTLYALGLIGVAVGVHRIQSRRLLRAERERSRQRELEDARTIEAAYNHLKATQEQLVQAEKMASLGHLTSGIAHEIRNPLNFVNNFTDLNREALAELATIVAERRDALPHELDDELQSLLHTLQYNTDKVSEHGRRADSVVKNMLRHSLSSKSERHPTDLNVLLRDYAQLTKRGFEAKYPGMGVEVETVLDPNLGRINVVPQDIGRVFVNLLNNAFEVLHDRKERDGESFRPRILLTTQRTPGIVEIRITDNGPGVPDELRDKIFNPFFTTREPGQGAGLGLSMSYEIVAAHGGSLELIPQQAEGATFVIRLSL